MPELPKARRDKVMHFLTLFFRPSALFFLPYVLPLAAAIDRAATARTLNQIFSGYTSRGDDSRIGIHRVSIRPLEFVARRRTSRAKYLLRRGEFQSPPRKENLGEKTLAVPRDGSAGVGLSFSYSFLYSPRKLARSSMT